MSSLDTALYPSFSEINRFKMLSFNTDLYLSRFLKPKSDHFINNGLYPPEILERELFDISLYFNISLS